MGNGNRRENRDTGRQRSEPEEGMHARQSEGQAGRREGRPRDDQRGAPFGTTTRSVTQPAGALCSGYCWITPYQMKATVDRTTGSGETWVMPIAMPVARYPAAARRYAVPQKYEFSGKRRCRPSLKNWSRSSSA